MAFRSHTDAFILMRNNALQSRHMFSDQFDDDRTNLVSGDAEMGFISRSSKLPPEWIDGVEEVQYEITKIKTKMKDMSALHDKHSNRPTLDDSINEELEIEIQTQEITQMFTKCQRLLQQVNSKSRIGTIREQELLKNISSSLARTLQDLSSNFRMSQTIYLNKLKSREERARHYFDTNMIDSNFEVDEEAELLFDKGFTSVQLQLVESNEAMIQKREDEIKKIAISLQDLNVIFKDLAHMIVDQGTVLDRIDYNIEKTAESVESGLGQLQKAEKHQKKNRKMLIICILFSVLIILVIILIIFKS